MNNYILLVTALLPIICGLFLAGMEQRLSDGKNANLIIISALIVTFISGVLSCFNSEELLLWRLGADIPVYFQVDDLSRLMVVLFTFIWLIAGIYGISYMKKDGAFIRFFAFFLLAEGMVCATCFAGNIITYYIFFEFMTLTTFPLVMHDKTHSAVMAGLKYLFYSIAGAFLSLFGIFLIYSWGGLGAFRFGGILSGSVTHGQNQTLLYAAAFSLIIGFGTKAGMWPMHSWLPAAHPEAPTPASALLSAVITKTGVLGIIRVVYYCIGPDLIRGSWVQKIWITLALLTVTIGSMMAYRERHLKRRLAYSTVSQISYIMFGLAVMNDIAYTGALMHVVFHAFIKTALFLIAGIYMHRSGKSDVDSYPETASKYPVLNWCYLICSLALVGIPPLSGFISKWYIGLGAFNAGIAPMDLCGAVVLIISALLTAGYLLPIGLKGFFPGKESDGSGTAAVNEPAVQNKNKTSSMTPLEAAELAPIIICTACTLVLGIFPHLLPL